MKKHHLWLGLAGLLALTLSEAGYLYEQDVSAKELSGRTLTAQQQTQGPLFSDIPADARQKEEKWRAGIQKQLDQGALLPARDFDGFFNEQFFSEQANPFVEMERIRRQTSDILKGQEKFLFNDSWDKWFTERMGTGRFKTDISRTDAEVTLTMRIPGLAGKTADVKLTKDFIKIAFSTANTTEEKKGNGVVKTEFSQSFRKMLPLPEDAVPGTGRVETAGDQLKIIFERKKY